MTATKLHQLFRDHGQSAWLDNLTRQHLTSGKLARMVSAGLRGVTSNPTIFQKAISGSSDYDSDFHHLVSTGASVEDSYWELVTADIKGALHLLRPLYDESGGGDGFVSIELDPHLAHDTAASIAAARRFHERIAEPNLLVKIPGTAAGVGAVRQMIAEGRNINITLIFSLDRYDEVIEAYLSGLESYDGDLRSVHSVASFFVSRVDTEVDRRLQKIGTDEALALRGKAAVAQAKLAYELFAKRFRGERWDALCDQGARVQRPLWASTSTKNPAYPDTLYVDELIGPDTVTTLPEATITAFEDHGTLARTIDTHVEESADVMRRLARVGIDMDDVGSVLEEQAINAFEHSFRGALVSLAGRHAAKRTA